MTKIRRKLNSLLTLGLACILLGGTTAFAVGGCSLNVVLKNSANEPVEKVNVELCQVVDCENGACELVPDMAGLGLSAQELLASPGAENAQLVFQYVMAAELEGEIRHTGSDGVARFTSLKDGVYLVFERGDQAVAFQPYLVVLPALIDGNNETDVTSVPKTSQTNTKTLLTMKLWNDNNDQAGKRPGSVEITVLRDGTPLRKVELSAANSWQHVFTMLPAGGVYTVSEEPVTDYQGEYIPVMEGHIIINSYTGGAAPEPPSAHVAVSKVWDDNDDAAGKRPVSVTVQLIQGNNVIKTATLSAANFWRHTFTGLDPAGSYTVQEIAVADYTAVYTGNAAEGITITNRYTGTTDPGGPPGPVIPDPELIDIPIVARWEDQDDAAWKRPETVNVYLISDGSIIKTAQLMAGNNWEGSFDDVSADLSYAVWQDGVEGYTTTYAGSAQEGFVVTNTYTEDSTDPGVPPIPPGPDEPSDPVVPPGEGDDPVQPSVKPDTPSGPSIPQTGAELLPVYLLMAAGVLLVLLGVVDLCRRREEP